jgi:hypothetical protein
MASADELASIAIDAAQKCFDESVGVLVKAAQGDIRALTDALHIVHKPKERGGPSEHIAFSLLAGAFKVANEQRDRPSDSN